MIFQYISCYCLSGTAVFFIDTSSISIHLMLLFIAVKNIKDRTYRWNFNTSHVTVYRFRRFRSFVRVWFQYISCYCLSFRRAYLSAFGVYFNTSHVTVYLLLKTARIVSLTFQYISCYCLSEISIWESAFISEFQYISCYCLSFSPST